MDKITLERIAKAHPRVRLELGNMYAEICAAVKGRAFCRFAYVLRTWDEQTGIYALGRTVKNPDGYDAVKKPLGNIVTWAKAGESYHNYGLAVDIVLILDKDGNGTYESASWDQKSDLDGDGISDWMEVVQIFKKYGWMHGGDWSKPKTDPPHFEKSLGYSVMDLKAAMQASKTTNGYVNI